MKNLSISKKLIVGFGIVLMLLIASIAMAIFSVNSIGRQTTAFSEMTVPNVDATWEMRRNLVSIERYMLYALDTANTAELQAVLDKATQDLDVLTARLDEYEVNQPDDRVADKIEAYRQKLAEAGALRVQVADLLLLGTPVAHQQAKTMFEEEYLPRFNEAAALIIEMSDIEEVRADEQAAAAESTERMAWVMLIAIAAVSLIITVVVVIAIRNSILKPVNEVVRVFSEIAKGNMKAEINCDSRDEMGQMANLIKESNKMQGAILGDVIEKFGRMAKGDLRIRVDIDYPGDFAALKDSVENMAASLNHTMQTINTAAEQVSTGSAQVASGAQALASGSTEQAASVEELTVAITKIAEQAAENTDNVRMATEFVGQAGAGVSAGNEHMHQLTAAMSEIGASSNQIANITKVIEDIAFQTNILALNAAIEAARAGNAGKGFAVVADEVRNLAGKSAEAAKQTGELIQASVATVAKGSQITEQTAQILQDVSVKAAKVVESIDKVDRASIEQTAAIEQIKQGLSQVSAVVQTNAATAEENSATSEEMSAQAATLREEVAKFKLDEAYGAQRLVAKGKVSELTEARLLSLDAALDLGKY